MEEKQPKVKTSISLNNKHRLFLDFLPQEPMLGIKIRNCEVRDDDEEFQNCVGIHIGIFFITLGYHHLV